MILRCWIRVPVYFGDATSTDVMYVIKGADRKISLNFFIETKDIKTLSDLCESKKLRFEVSKKFFETISDEYINVQFSPQLKSDDFVARIRQVAAQ